MSAKDTQVGGDHYLKMGVEPWDVIDSWKTSARCGFYRGNALKYLMRAGTKGDDENRTAAAVEDLKKAIHYLSKLIEVLEGR